MFFRDRYLHESIRKPLAYSLTGRRSPHPTIHPVGQYSVKTPIIVTGKALARDLIELHFYLFLVKIIPNEKQQIFISRTSPQFAS